MLYKSLVFGAFFTAGNKKRALPTKAAPVYFYIIIVDLLSHSIKSMNFLSISV